MRSLEKDLRIKSCGGRRNNNLDIDIRKIKKATLSAITTADDERMFSIMKSKKSVALIAVVVVLAVGISVLAASGTVKTWYASSSSNAEYKTLPSEEDCLEDIGYVPVLVEEFENGYAFKNGSVVNNDLRDEENNSIEKFKSVTFRYEKDGDVLYLSQEKFNSGINMNGTIVKSVEDTDIYYYSYTNKFVPGDYELTEEDKAAEESGELVFSYGSEEVEIIEVTNVRWVKDGVHCSLMQLDGKLSEDELVLVAEEIICSK